MLTTAVKNNFHTFAKLGYVARGVVYFVIGGLAVLVALGEGGETTNSKGAIEQIMAQPFGNLLLILLVIGLLGYVAWRFTQSIKDTDDHGTSAKGLAVRAGLFISGVTHLLLALWTIKLLIGMGSGGSSGNMSEQWLSADVRQILVGLAGAIFIGVGCAHLFKGWTARFERYMDIPADKNQWAQPICRFGLIARGVVWLIVGGILIRSSLMFGSDDVKGMADALDWLHEGAYGNWLLGSVAVGLVAFGVYSILEAIYRRIETD